MSEALKITLTAVAGIAVFVIGQIIQKLFVEPIQDQRRIKGKIVHALALYTQIKTHASPELRRLASETMKDLASQLQASASVIPLYSILARLRIVPNRRTIVLTAMYLASIANDPDDTDAEWNMIIKLLNIKGGIAFTNWDTPVEQNVSQTCAPRIDQ